MKKLKLWIGIIIAFLASLFSGCSMMEDPVIVQTECQPKVALEMSDPTPLKLRDVKWIVVTPKNIDKIWSELKAKNFDLVLFGLTDEGYQALSLNTAELLKYMIEQKQVTDSYRLYYEKPE